MKLKISDMMDHVESTPVEIREKDIASAERIKEVTMSKVRSTQTNNVNGIKKFGWTKLIAVVAMIGILVTSVAAVCLSQGWVHFFSNESEAEKAASMGAQNGIAGHGSYSGNDYDETNMLKRVNIILEGFPEDTLIYQAQGEPTDGWNRMRAVQFDFDGKQVQDHYYQADSLSTLSKIWETNLDLSWLEDHYEAVPGAHLATLRTELDQAEPFYVSIVGEYRGENGELFNLQYYYEKDRLPADQFYVVPGYHEYYETKDGITVAIAMADSETGKSVFWVELDCGQVYLSMFGTQLELEEIKAIVDSMAISSATVAESVVTAK